ncbi:MAG: hypothetical protein H8E66_23210 [Planctomycetes bacterium]|nr:hypothetical protein [Planctomycetota bacterium]
MTWFLQSIGIEGEVLEHLDQAQLAFQRPVVLWFGVLLLIPVAYLIWRRQQNLDTPSPRFRLILNIARVFVTVVILLILSGPYLRLDMTVQRKPVLAILLDNTQSMQLPIDPTTTTHSQTRFARAQEALADGLETLEELAEDYALRVFEFSDGLQPLAIDDIASAETKPGNSSFIGEAIQQVVDDAAAESIAGVVLISDGQNTGGPSVSEAAHFAAAADAAVFAIPVDSNYSLGDVSIVDVDTSALVTVGDTVRVNVAVESTELDGESITVELKDGERLLDTEQVVLDSTHPQRIELTFEAEKVGASYLDVNIPVLAAEPRELHANNVDTAFVRITDEKLRVLVLDGHPRWDFRFLKNALNRDGGLAGRDDNPPDVIVETEWKRWSEQRQHDALPQTVEELSEYHVIVLGDVSPDLFDSSFRETLIEAVREKGVGLIVAAGPNAMPHRFDPDFRSILPVRMQSGKSGVEAAAYEPFKIELAGDGMLHDGMRLRDDDVQNREAWDELPEFFWCSAVQRPAAGATVLAWNSAVEGRFGKMPLMAWHHAGEGKVIFVGTDATWRWRLNVADRYFYKFWGQSIRFVARADQLGKKSWIAVHPVQVGVGEEAEIELWAFDEEGSPLAERTQRITFVGADTTEPIKLSVDPETPGRYTAKFTPSEAGTHRLLYQPGNGTESAQATIQARLAPDEYRHPHVDRATLELLASTSGGELLELVEFSTLPAKLSGEPHHEQIHREVTIWDNWLILLVLTSVYVTDIGMRRLTGLS